MRGHASKEVNGWLEGSLEMDMFTLGTGSKKREISKRELADNVKKMMLH
jgi:hypothetical protein